MDAKTDPAAYYAKLSTDEQTPSSLKFAARLFTEADKFVKLEKEDDALEAALRTLKLFRELQDHDGVAETLRIIAMAYCMKDERKEADTMLKKELALFQADGDAKGEARMLLALAEVNSDRRGSKKREEAFTFATQARKMFREQQNRRMEGNAFVTLMSIELKRKKDPMQRALGVLRMVPDALAMFDYVGDKKGQASVMHWKADSHCRCGQLEEAVKATKAARDLYHETGDQILEALECKYLAKHYLSLKQAKSALPEAQEALRIFKELGLGGSRERDARGVLCRALIENKDSESALWCAEELLTECTASGDRRGEIDALLMIAQGYLNLVPEETRGLSPYVPQDAVDAAEKALEIAQEVDDTDSEARIMSLIASMHYRRQDYGKAVEFAETALLCGEEVDDLGGKAMAHHTLVSVHLLNKRFEDAAQCANDARALFHSAENPWGEAASLLTLSQIRFEQGRVDAAVAAAREAQTIYTDVRDKRGEGYALQHIAEQRNANVEPERALYAATRARTHMQKLGDDYGDMRMLLIIAQNRILLLAQKREANEKITPAWEDVAKAMQSAKELVAVSKKLGDKRNEATGYCTMAKNHIFHERFPDARDALDKAITLFIEVDDISSEAYARVLYGDGYYREGDLQMAVSEGKKALALFTKCKDSGGEAAANELLDRLRQFEFRVDDTAGPFQMQQRLAALDQASALAPAVQVDPSMVRTTLQDVTKKMVGSSMDVEMDLPLMDMGINSMNAVLYRNRLGDLFEGVDLPITLVFDYPSMRSIYEVILDHSG